MCVSENIYCRNNEMRGELTLQNSTSPEAGFLNVTWGWRVEWSLLGPGSWAGNGKDLIRLNSSEFKNSTSEQPTRERLLYASQSEERLLYASQPEERQHQQPTKW